MTRKDGRELDEIRRVEMLTGFTRFAEGSCLISCGDTMVLCTSSVEDRVPDHVKKGGWITAEYSMLPRANRERSRRDVSKLKLSPRSAEIQRLIGRSLRSAVDLDKLEGVSITVDCDVLQEMPVSTFVSGISAGVVGGVPMLDLQYSEDSKADVDLNCIMDGNGNIIELQGTGEGRPFTLDETQKLLELCRKGNELLQAKQKEILGDLV